MWLLLALAAAGSAANVCTMGVLPDTFSLVSRTCSNPCCPEAFADVTDGSSLKGGKWICWSLFVQLPRLNARWGQLLNLHSELNAKAQRLSFLERAAPVFEVRQTGREMAKQAREALELVSAVARSNECAVQAGCPAKVQEMLAIARRSLAFVPSETLVIPAIAWLGIAFSIVTLAASVAVLLYGLSHRVLGSSALYSLIAAGVAVASALYLCYWAWALVGMSAATVEPLAGRIVFRIAALVTLWILVALVVVLLDAIVAVFSVLADRTAAAGKAAVVVVAALASLYAIAAGVAVELSPALDLSLQVIYFVQVLLTSVIIALFAVTYRFLKASKTVAMKQDRLALLSKLIAVAVILFICFALQLSVALLVTVQPVQDNWVGWFLKIALPVFVSFLIMTALVGSMFVAARSAKTNDSSHNFPLVAYGDSFDEPAPVPFRYSANNI